MFAGERVKNGAPADGLDRRIGTEHKTVPTKGGNGLVETDLDEGLFSRRQLLPIKEHRRGQVFCCPCVKANFCPVFEGARGTGEQRHLDVDQVRRRQGAGCGHHITPLDQGSFHSLEIDGRTLAGMDLLNLFVVDL